MKPLINEVQQKVLEHQRDQLRMMIYASLFAALIAAGSYLVVPIGPVPIVLQNMVVLLAGLLLGKRWGFYCVALYLFAGVCGLPVFSLGKGGIGHLAGITGGYLLGYLPAVFITGLISTWFQQRLSSAIFVIISDMFAMVMGSIVIYTFGLSWMMLYFGKSLSTALAIGALPFIIGDIIKITAAAIIAAQLRPLVNISSK